MYKKIYIIVTCMVVCILIQGVQAQSQNIAQLTYNLYVTGNGTAIVNVDYTLVVNEEYKPEGYIYSGNVRYDEDRLELPDENETAGSINITENNLCNYNLENRECMLPKMVKEGTYHFKYSYTTKKIALKSENLWSLQYEIPQEELKVPVRPDNMMVNLLLPEKDGFFDYFKKYTFSYIGTSARGQIDQGFWSSKITWFNLSTYKNFKINIAYKEGTHSLMVFFVLVIIILIIASGGFGIFATTQTTRRRR
ncbi:hypothetical protein BEH94_09210 [Candidatus Altiarchaeales archaeon WOR_SM1_SCG]|nr:hypothetical protein BEH94_09210 [Candidatus Altiarchaeales archaeon WOR_SM1_SCG]